MTIQTLSKPQAAVRLREVPTIPRKEGQMYAITFDLDIESLKLNYGDPYNNAYGEIRTVLQMKGFTWQQGSVYFGGESIKAVIELSRDLAWFAASVRDIRMLRIEELNDLMPAVQQA